jgi:hypothetical protein
MNTRLAPIAFATVLVGCISSAFAGEISEKTAASEPRQQARKVAAVEPKKKPSTFMERWRRTSDRPCDSLACRPQKFAWAPTAPGD